MQSAVLAQSNRDWKKDVFGRTYRVAKDQIFFSIDEDYKKTFPDVSQVSIHLAESTELETQRKFFDAIFLNRSIISCNYFFDKDKYFTREAKKKLSRLLSMNAHQEKKIQRLTDLHGCYKNDQLILRNDSFAYTILTDSKFVPVFPKDEFQWAREGEEYNWKLNYLRIQLPNENEEETLEEVYKNYENKIFSKPKERISLMIGETYHKHNFTGDYLALWDNRRGLIDTIKKSIQFERVKITDSENQIAFLLKDSSGINRKLLGREYIFFIRQKGFFVLLLYPEKFAEQGNRIAKEMKIQFK